MSRIRCIWNSSFIVYEDGKEVDFVNKDRKTKKEVENFLKAI